MHPRKRARLETFIQIVALEAMSEFPDMAKEVAKKMMNEHFYWKCIAEYQKIEKMARKLRAA